MSYSIQIGESGFEQLASNAGYAAFGHWVDSLDHKKYGQLVHLYEHGWCQNLDDLAGQLDAALSDDGPKITDVKSTAEGLQEILHDRPKDAIVATVTDGFGEGENSDDATDDVKSRLLTAGYTEAEIDAKMTRTELVHAEL